MNGKKIGEMSFIWIIFILSILQIFYCTAELTGGQVNSTPFPAIALNTNSCMEDLGCFPLGGDFYDPKYRPVDSPPLDRKIIDVKFLINTERTQKEPYTLRAVDVKTSTLKDFGIDKEVETIVAIPGNMDNPYNWIPPFREEYFKHGKYNFIAVDWSAGNYHAYPVSCANARVVGAEIAFLVKNMQEKLGLDVKKVHIIGHSLGGHVTGYAGERIPGLGRITGLDPAETEFQNLPIKVRLDPSDATFVDVVHTDSKPFKAYEGLGMAQLVGHLDFYPNGGEEQPDCEGAKALGEGKDFYVCKHIRSIKYFQESINSKCQMVGYACKDIETFKEGKCASCGTDGEKCARFGLRSIESFQLKKDRPMQKLFFTTNGKPPYCLYHYQGIMNSANWPTEGNCSNLNVTVIGSLDSDSLIVKPSLNEEDSKKFYTFLFTTQKDLGDLTKVTLDFQAEKDATATLPLDKLVLKPMFEIDQQKTAAGTREFCLAKNEGLKSGQPVTVNAAKTC